MEIALRIWNFNSSCAQMLFDQKIQLAFESPWLVTHFFAPDDHFKINRAVAEFFEIGIRRRIVQRGRMLARRSDECLTYFIHVAAISYSNWQPKTHPRIAVCPVCDRRIDELLIRHDHGDAVVGHDNRAARPNLLYLAGNPRDFNAIADGDRPLGKNEQAADEIACDVFQTKPHTHANRASEYRQCSEMDAGIIQNDDYPDNQNGVADDLRNGVLQSPIESAFDQEASKEETFCAR